MMKVLFAIINLFIHYVHGYDVSTDIGPIVLSASIGPVPPPYRPLNPEDEIASANAKSHLEWLRHKFPSGSGFLPPLDPFHQDHIGPINIQNGIIAGQLDLNNLNIEGAKEFVLKIAEVRMQTHTVTEDISIPQIVGTVNFRANIIFGILPISITGDLKVIVKNIDVAGSYATQSTPYNSVDVYQITGNDIQVKADDLELHFTNLSLDANEQTIKKWWNKLKDHVGKMINQSVVSVINEVLTHYTTRQVDDFLLAP